MGEAGAAGWVSGPGVDQPTGMMATMSAHTRVEVGVAAFLWVRESWLPEVAALFTEDELVRDEERFRYETTAGQLRDRLQVLGFTHAYAHAEVERAFRERRDPPADADVPAAMAALLDDLRTVVNLPDDDDHLDRLMDFREPDDFCWVPQAALRLAVGLVDDPGTRVRYNLDDLQAFELYGPGVPLTELARDQRQRQVATDAPLVVLTEGSTDAQLLAAGLRVTHPHLVGFLRFMDFGGDAEGSVSALQRLVRAFAGAGIANRVIALADNDTAAFDGLAKLKAEGLPAGYRIVHYPPLDMLSAYPVLDRGSSTVTLQDVNGSAGGLEMYLGRDVLAAGGVLAPVQWGGFVDGQQAYQGSLAKREKVRVQKEFRKKARRAVEDPMARADQDWTGVHSIVEAIISAFDTPCGPSARASPADGA